MGTASRDGKTVAAGTARTLSVCDLLTGRALAEIKVSSEQVTALAFSPEGRRIAVAGADGAVAVWDAASGDKTLKLAIAPCDRSGDLGCIRARRVHDRHGWSPQLSLSVGRRDGRPAGEPRGAHRSCERVGLCPGRYHARHCGGRLDGQALGRRHRAAPCHACVAQRFDHRHRLLARRPVAGHLRRGWPGPLMGSRNRAVSAPSSPARRARPSRRPWCSHPTA